jgi:hypothetical protein
MPTQMLTFPRQEEISAGLGSVYQPLTGRTERRQNYVNISDYRIWNATGRDDKRIYTGKTVRDLGVWSSLLLLLLL